jgi:hypothetical protein
MFDLVLLPDEQNRAILYLSSLSPIYQMTKILMQRAGENDEKIDLIYTSEKNKSLPPSLPLLPFDFSLIPLLNCQSGG